MIQTVSKNAVLYSAVYTLSMLPLTLQSEEIRSFDSVATIKKTLLTELQIPKLHGDIKDIEKEEDRWCYLCQPLPAWAEVAEDQYAEGGLRVITVAKLHDQTY